MTQAYGDLEDVIHDFEQSRNDMQFIGADDCGPQQSYILNKDLKDTAKSITYNMVIEVSASISERLKKKPDKNYLGFTLVAGHGMVYEGMQYLLLNQYCSTGKFYKLCPIEKLVRLRTGKFKNHYEIVIMACCREVHDPKLHTNCIEAKSEAEAIELLA